MQSAQGKVLANCEYYTEAKNPTLRHLRVQHHKLAKILAKLFSIKLQDFC